MSHTLTQADLDHFNGSEQFYLGMARYATLSIPKAPPILPKPAGRIGSSMRSPSRKPSTARSMPSPFKCGR